VSIETSKASKKRNGHKTKNSEAPLEFTFTCPLPSGLHARPSAQLADLANVFACGFLLTNLRNGMEGNLKSALSIISTNVRFGDVCRISLTGGDRDAALTALRNFVEHELAQSEDAPASAASSERNASIPRALKQSGAAHFFGRAASPGIGQGKAVLLDRPTIPKQMLPENTGNPYQEQQKIENALKNVQTRVRTMLTLPGSSAQKGVIRAQLSILGDVSLAEKLAEKIAQGRSAAEAVIEAGEFFLDVFQHAESTYLQERALDMQDVLQQLLAQISGLKFVPAAALPEEPSIAVAEVLSPQQLLAMDRKWLAGLVLENASTTNHAVILARSLGIPTVVGVKEALRNLLPRQEIVVDANRSLVISSASAAVRQFYEREIALRNLRRQIPADGITDTAQTSDGRKLEIAANVSSQTELAPAFEHGADGIGIFRTEMLFVGQESEPSEEEQFSIYSEAARLAGDRSVIIRTLDVGGDKPIAQLSLPKEANPFLGYRGVRIYSDFRDVIRVQVRAIARASAFGRVQMMVPMVSSLEEVSWVRSLLREVQDELKAKNVKFDPAMPLGIMIETPSVAFMLDHLASEVDFFSIGTNDLAQYFFAAERGNDRVSSLADVRNPAFLRLLQQIVREVRKTGKWIGMCGDMAADASLLPLLVGLGLDEISLPAFEIAALKQRLRRLSVASCEALLAKAIACRHTDEVKVLLKDHPASEEVQPLLAQELVVVDSDVADKDAAIRTMVEMLFLRGRTDDPQTIEEAIWDREAISSTGLVRGFAIPHCRLDAVTTDSVVILKARNPIDWGSPDGEPVHMMILLTVRQSQPGNKHLQILSKLARKLMDDDFHARMLSLEDPAAIVSYWGEQLG
jgi:multiphosphoryl transfer protein